MIKLKMNHNLQQIQYMKMHTLVFFLKRAYFLPVVCIHLTGIWRYIFSLSKKYILFSLLLEGTFLDLL